MLHGLIASQQPEAWDELNRLLVGVGGAVWTDSPVTTYHPPPTTHHLPPTTPQSYRSRTSTHPYICTSK
jgi:hypothetical protein